MWVAVNQVIGKIDSEWPTNSGVVSGHRESSAAQGVGRGVAGAVGVTKSTFDWTAQLTSATSNTKPEMPPAPLEVNRPTAARR